MSERIGWVEHLAHRGRDYVVTGVIFFVVAFTLTGLYTFAKTVWLQAQDQTDWFEYHSITYDGLDPDARAGLGSLRMISDMQVNRPLVLEFHDVLRCRPIGSTEPHSFVSENPESQAFVAEPYPRRHVRWLYHGDYVTGRDCIVRSSITAEIDGVTKTQTIDSPAFVIEG